MRFGAHLPVAGFEGRLASGEALVELRADRRRSRLSTLCANDHLVAWLAFLAVAVQAEMKR